MIGPPDVPARASDQALPLGFTVIPAVLGADEIQELISAINSSDLRRGRAGVRHLLNLPAVTRVANDPRLLHHVQEVLGMDAFPFRATLFDKCAKANWLITWHQDTALPLAQNRETPGWGPWSVKEGVVYAHAPAEALEKVIALRLHLDDSHEENGPLRVIPGTHSKGVLTDAAVEAIVTTTESVTCRVPRGGIILMRPLIIHASSKSHSAGSRRVLHIEYAIPGTVPAPLRLANT